MQETERESDKDKKSSRKIYCHTDDNALTPPYLINRNDYLACLLTASSEFSQISQQI